MRSLHRSAAGFLLGLVLVVPNPGEASWDGNGSLGSPQAEPRWAAASSTPIVVDGPWYEFFFTEAGVPAVGCQPDDPGGGGCIPSSAGNSVFAGAPPWTLAADPAGVLLKVTDAFLAGDAFEAFDFGASLGATPAVPAVGNCGDDPVPCSMDPLISSGTFLLPAGMHSITITPTASPFGSGAAYFRAVTVLVFADGFESGDTSQWSSAVP